MSTYKRKTSTLPQPGWAIYLRTSNQEVQNPENSQRRQREAIHRNLLSVTTHPTYSEYIDNLSGRYAHNRPSYQRMLDDARSGRFSHVAVENAERFGRNDTEALRAIDELAEIGVVIRFADYPDLDPVDPDDRILVSLSFTLARRESIKLGQRVRGGIHAKMKGGGFAGLAPDGYRNAERRAEGENRTLSRYDRWIEIDEERACIWRYAWDLLLEARYSLEDICAALHARGYVYRTGRSFLEINRLGHQKANKSTLARIFHNWFYAGWVVSEKAGILPKTIRGEWKPIVTTEEFEYGLKILHKRDQYRTAKRKREYLLKGLVYVQLGKALEAQKLICSTSNAARPGGGTAYYCISRSGINIKCHVVDGQIAGLLQNIQIDPSILPCIRDYYSEEIAAKLGRLSPDARAEAEASLKAVNQEEARAARLYAAGKMTDEVWNSLWMEWQDRRTRLQQALHALELRQENHVSTLDSALQIIARVGTLYNRLEFEKQRELLGYVVERIVVDPNGRVIQLRLLPPFAYIDEIRRRVEDRQKTSRKQRTTADSRGYPEKSSVYVPSGRAGGTRTHTLFRAGDFKSLASAISPQPRHCPPL